MKQPDSVKRGEFSTPPFFKKSLAVFIVLFVTGAAFASGADLKQGDTGRTVKTTLTIDEAIDMAMRQNRDITNSKYNVQSQRYSVDASQALFDLKLIPTGSVSLSGGDASGYNYTAAGVQLQKKLEYGTTVSVGPQVTRSSNLESGERYTTDMGVTITQPLLKGVGKEITTNSVQTAEAAYKTSLRNVYQTKANTMLETISAYYDAVRQMGMLQLYENLETRLKGHAEIARAREKVGVSTPMDTYRAEIPLRETEDAMIKVSESIQNAKDKIKFILALPQDMELELTVPEEPEAMKLSLNDAIDTAIKERIEIEQMNQDIAEAERKAEVMKDNILPELNLVLRYGRYATADRVDISRGLNLDRYSISVQMGSDIFRTAEKAAYNQSLISIKTLKTSMAAKREDISWQVRKQWLALQEAVKRMEIRKAQIKQGEEKLALAEVKFTHGMADNFDVIEAEKELQNARVNLLDAGIEYAIGNYNLKAILGTLVPRN